MDAARKLRTAFRVLNRSFMVPVFRCGLGPWLVSPVAGYIMVLTTVGHRTGQRRHTPVNYALLEGDVCCIAGFGSRAHWARNLAVCPEAEVQLPAGRMAGMARVVQDEAERLRIGRQVLRNAGFAGFFLGFNPFRPEEAALARGLAGVPVYRITPAQVLPATFDPGGAGWITSMLAWVALLGLVGLALLR